MMNLKTSGVVLALAALPVTALALTALAQSPTPAPDATKQEARAKFRAACGADVQKFCANIERAKGAMRSCLTAHETDLSDTCKAARAERAAARSKEKS
jgi:cysteine rich repeat protein